MSVLDDLTISEIAALAVQDENAGALPVRVRVIAAKGAMAELTGLGDLVGHDSSSYQHLLDERALSALAAPGAVPMLRGAAA
jgi:hypothetical protein